MNHSHGLYFFFTGLTNTIILPTVNGYLISLDAPNGFLGAVVASFSLTGLISAPVFGFITDKTTQSLKLCLIVSALIEIAGNLMYFVGTSYSMLCIARLVAGIGSGAASSVLGVVSRTTSLGKRTSVISVLTALREFGVAIAPSFNIILHNVNGRMGLLSINQFNSPGLVMTGAWTIHLLLLTVLFKDSGTNTRQNASEVKYQQATNENESELLLTEDIHNGSLLKHKPNLKQFMREEVILCISANCIFVVVFNGLETAATPLTLLYFNWDSLYNSYMFFAAGFCVLISYVVLGKLSNRFSDRTFLLLGCVGSTISYSLITVCSFIFVLNENIETPNSVLPLVCLSIFFLGVSLPFVLVSITSLFSKITDLENQGFNQGILWVSRGIGLILGPIWGSSLATRSRMPILGSVDLTLILFMTALICMSFKKLVPNTQQ
ncbi:major facilitator superfamily domain-containing protein 8-like [Styela clava]